MAEDKITETSEVPETEEKKEDFDEIAKLKAEKELLEKQLGQLQAELERLKQSVSFFSQPTSTPPPTREEPSEDLSTLFYENPSKAIEIISKKIEQKIMPQIQQLYSTIQAEQIRQYFYSKYPDLKGYEKIVGIIAQEVTEKNPNLPLETLLEKIALTTREYLASLRGSKAEEKKKTIYSETATKTPPPSKGEELIEYNPEEELKAEMEARKKWIASKLGGKTK